jgi:DNA-binding response OmpR family regulator
LILIDCTEEVLLMPTALIVEDEPEANHLLSMLVQLRGYRTESAFTGGEALEKVHRRPPDLVFLDLMLPDINGYEVCKKLKTRKATSLIPVIMVTARVAAENRIESFGVGADDYIPKPYTPDQIFRAMTDASSWHHRIGGSTIDGIIPIELASEEETQRLFGQFRNILVARTTMELDAINRVSTALTDIWKDALCWGRQPNHRLNTSLSFHVQSELLAITINDTSGWLAENRYDPVERWPLSFAAACFDEVINEEPGHRMTLHKGFPRLDRPASP